MDKKETKSEYVKTIREGAIAANIFCRETEDGRKYHSYKISRAYKTQEQEGTDQFSYSENLFPRNAEAVAKVATEAGAECTKLDGELDNPVKQAA